MAAFDADGVPRWSLPMFNADQPAAVSSLDRDLHVVAHKAGKTDFVCAGRYVSAVAAGKTSLAPSDGGVLLAEVDRTGTLIALRPLRSTKKLLGDGYATSIRLGPSPSGLWVGGAMGERNHGGWVQAVRW